MAKDIYQWVADKAIGLIATIVLLYAGWLGTTVYVHGCKLSSIQTDVASVKTMIADMRGKDEKQNSVSVTARLAAGKLPIGAAAHGSEDAR